MDRVRWLYSRGALSTHRERRRRARCQLAIIESTGGRWFGAGGDADVGDEMTTAHGLLNGSNTKAWTAAAVLTLVDEGRLALDDSAATWVPQRDGPLTVRNLLQHTSGLGEYFEHEALPGRRGALWTPQELIQLGQEARADGPSPTAVYAITNYIALGLLLEAVDGDPVDAVWRDRVLEPLGLERSGLAVDANELPDGLALGDGGELGEVRTTHPSVGWAADGGYSTAEELATFYQSTLAGELYSAATHREQLTSVEADLGFDEEGVETRYGLGLMVVGIHEQTVVGHLGAVEGFFSMAMTDEGTGALAVTLSNGSVESVVSPTLHALRVADR